MRKESISVSETPSLIKQWDNKSNTKIGINPDTTSAGSQKKAFWYCEKHKSTYSQIIRDVPRNVDYTVLCFDYNSEIYGDYSGKTFQAIIIRDTPERLPFFH